uniref:Coiled-coil domain containing 38 n=7 Tax=Hominoidea TaxID=314295 RepID=F8VRK3_HUMAN
MSSNLLPTLNSGG